MRQEPNATHRSGWTIVSVVLAFFVLFVMYFLSAGPMCWLGSRGLVTSWFINFVYYPIILLCENCHPFGWLWLTYRNLWGQ